MWQNLVNYTQSTPPKLWQRMEKLLGLNPNHKPKCCFKSQKKRKEICTPTCLSHEELHKKQKGWDEEEWKRRTAQNSCHLPAPEIASPPISSPARNHMKGLLGWAPIWWRRREGVCVCVCLDGLASYGGSLRPSAPSLKKPHADSCFLGESLSLSVSHTNTYTHTSLPGQLGHPVMLLAAVYHKLPSAFRPLCPLPLLTSPLFFLLTLFWISSLPPSSTTDSFSMSHPRMHQDDFMPQKA